MDLIKFILGIFSNILIIFLILFLIILMFKNNYLVSIAARNVFRNVRRSLITISAIAIGAIVIIIFGGYINDMYYKLKESTIHSQIGHLQIYKKGFNEFGITNPEKYRMYDFEKVDGVIENDAILKTMIDTIMPVVEFSGLVGAGDNSTSFIGKGVDVEKDRALTSYDRIKEGQKLNPEDNGKSTLGHILAKKINANVGDSLTILVATSKVGINVIDSDVKGTTESMSSDYDKVVLKMPITDAWKLLAERYADKLIILLKNSKDQEKFVNRLDELIKTKNMDIEYKTWEDLAVFYKQVKVLYDGIFNFIKLIICMMVIIFIANTLFMSVMERVAETGTLRTIGTTKFLIVQNNIIEALIMGIIGGAAGIVIGIILSSIINIFGIPMPTPPGSTHGYTANIRLDETSFKNIIFGFKLSVLTAFFGSILPAKKSIDKNIVEALRHY